jgi:gliding motility-associated-like protein
MIKKIILAITLLALCCSLYAQTQLHVDAGLNDTICRSGPSGTVPLYGTTATPDQFFYYRWHSQPPGALFSDSTSLNTIATISETTTFTLLGFHENYSFMQNGNFSAGNSGFTSSYVYDPADLYDEGKYAVVSQAHDVHTGFITAYDHTCNCPTGKYMIVNGNVTPEITVWAQSIPVMHNAEYVFSAWVMTANGNTIGQTCPENERARLQFKINGVLLGEIFQAPATVGVWQQFYIIWNSGLADMADFSIVNQNTEPGGNDFGLDDLHFALILSAEDEVTVTVGETKHTWLADTLCLGETFSHQGIEITPVQTGVMEREFTLQTPVGCDSTVHVTLTVGAAPSLAFSVNEKPCEDAASSISLSASGGIAPYRCLWNTGAEDMTLYSLPAGTYTATVTDALGCESKDSVLITRNDLALAASVEPTHCKENNGSATVHATGGSGSYTFVADESNVTPTEFLSDNCEFTRLPAGSYHAAITDGVCTLSVDFAIVNLGVPEACFQASYDQHSIAVPVTFINCSENASSYTWDFGDGNTSTDENPLHSYADFGLYEVTLFAFDKYDCFDSLVSTVKLIDEAACWLPSAFTPNKNGINETFGPVCYSIQPEDFSFVIYDRWGSKIFESRDINLQWDGTINGKDAPPAVYMWRFYYRNELSKLMEKRGFVVVTK